MHMGVIQDTNAYRQRDTYGKNRNMKKNARTETLTQTHVL